jgi:hypothetical protein
MKAYIGYHPSGGFRKYTFAWDRKTCQKKVVDVFCNPQKIKEIWKRKVQRGWKIIEVEVKQKEPVTE